MRETTGSRVGGVMYAALALVVFLALAVGTGLAGTRIPPGIAGLPQGGGDHLAGPESLDDIDPDSIENIVYQPSVLECHRWENGAMTQTRHPRSPACVAGWDDSAGNGGSTARGVDGSVIRIGVPGRVTSHLHAFEDYVNSRYEFYGRSITFTPLGPVDTAAAQRAAVATAASQGVFAAIGVDPSNARTVYDPDAWLSGLAAEQIIGVASGGVSRETTLSASGPYSWSITPTSDQLQRYVGKLVCETLKDRPARFSPSFPETTRTFATLGPGETSYEFRPVDPQIITTIAGECGVEIRHYEFSHVSADPTQAARDQLLYQQMADDGITTIIVLGAVDTFSTVVPHDMEAAGYRPEFVTVERNNGVWYYAPDAQQHSVIGVRPGPPPQDFLQPPVIPMLIDAGYTRNQAEDLTQQGPYAEVLELVNLVAAGIQAAGPDLTPENFAAGLEATRFPSPTDAERWGRGAVGLQVGDRVLERDVALGWFDPDNMAAGYAEMTGFIGRFCLIADGRRFALTDPFPDTDAAFHDLSQDCEGPGTVPDPG